MTTILQTSKEEVACEKGGIGDIPVSIRTFNALVAADVLTIAQLEQAITDGTLRSLPKIGPKTVDNIDYGLSNYTPELEPTSEERDVLREAARCFGEWTMRLPASSEWRGTFLRCHREVLHALGGE